MGDVGSNDQILLEKAESLASIGDLNGAKQIAAQLTDRHLLMNFWHGILDRQFESGDLQQAKETIGSISDESFLVTPRMWGWVADLAKSGDTDGAMWLVNRLPVGFRHGDFFFSIARAQAEKDDWVGAEQTLEMLQENPLWRYMALLEMVRIKTERGDTDGAHRLASMMDDSFWRGTPASTPSDT